MNETALPPLPRPRLAARLAGRLFALLLRLLGATWRREAEGLDTLDGMLARGEKVMAVFWHGGYLPLFYLLAGRPARILTSRSFRGEVIAEICCRFGYDGGPIPDPGGGTTLDAVRRALDGCRLAALAVDGPLGPAHVVKPGAVRLASDLAFAVLPVAAAADRSWVLARRWDRLAIPRPFARLGLVCGEPVQIPAGLPEAEVASWCGRLRERLEAVERRARQMAGDAGNPAVEPTDEQCRKNRQQRKF
jgi:lysophospholipid acyltransferase (LPLAT)-like uncharacterized protein